ncbi:glyoxalase [Paenibacillus sp. J31TS4]|uniref:VOC family protein n=1 Tax=Paenibacillus sp. J31TS4 TaxID=2807195 RepID=UPI001AFCDC28|nr:VOC family protein [Paenibacillus sp. J31TS4]GIP37668.1 glyoxalase [Paenibacillus sp. J31TS4]
MHDAILGLDHVQLAAPPGCEEAARTFYGGVLGLPELEKPETLRGRGGVWFRCGAQELHIGVQGDFRPADKAHPAFAVRDLPAVREALRQAGVDLIEDDALPGAIRFFVRDPFGNRIEFLQRLA